MGLQMKGKRRVWGVKEEGGGGGDKEQIGLAEQIW